MLLHTSKTFVLQQNSGHSTQIIGKKWKRMQVKNLCKIQQTLIYIYPDIFVTKNACSFSGHEVSFDWLDQYMHGPSYLPPKKNLLLWPACLWICSPILVCVMSTLKLVTHTLKIVSTNTDFHQQCGLHFLGMPLGGRSQTTLTRRDG